jgi:putative transposase
MATLETVRKAIADGDPDFLRKGVRLLAQAVMEAEVTELTGAAKGERDPERGLTHRNGYRDRRWDTRVGTIELAIPRVSDGSYFPSLLEPRRRAERALLAVVQEAYLGGVSTRRVDDLVRALGIDGVSRSEVSRMCTALDAEVAAFRARPLGEVAHPYVWLDATYVKVREAGRVVSMAVPGVATTGERRVLGLELAAGNDEGSAWPRFIRSLVERGLRGVRLVISDDHAGLVKAVREQLLGAGWQRSSGPPHPQRPGPRPALGPEHGRLGRPDGLRAARRRCRPGPARPGHRRPPPALRGRRRPPDGGRARPARSLRLPRAPPPPDPLDKPARAAQQGDQAPDRGGRHLSDRPSVLRLVRLILAEQDDEWQDGRRYFRPDTMGLIDHPIQREEVAPALLIAS